MEFDLDAARAARAEARKEQHSFRFQGDTFALPDELPLSLGVLIMADNPVAAMQGLLGCVDVAVTAKSVSGGAIKLETAEPHGLKVGQEVAVRLKGEEPEKATIVAVPDKSVITLDAGDAKSHQRKTVEGTVEWTAEWDRFYAKGPTIDDLGALLNGIAPFYGFVSPGESRASANSSKKNGTRPRRTSNGTTGSTSAKRAGGPKAKGSVSAV